MKRNPILTTNNVKTMKGSKLGYLTYIAYLSPFTANSKGINLCSHASKGCAEACLVGSGNARFEVVRKGRLAKTEYFLSSRVEFLNQVKNEIQKAIDKNKDKAIITIRLNGTSDIPYEKFKIFEGKNIFEVYPDVIFYDYTKNYLRFDKVLPSNYHLTFSRSETNHTKAIEMLNRGFNVAMVMTNLVSTYEGFEVINGDETDLRFLDKKNVIVGLKYKKMTGRNANNKLGIESGFVIDTSKPSIEDLLNVPNEVGKVDIATLLEVKARVLRNTWNMENV